MRLVARRQGHFSRAGFGGAVAVIGLNTNLTERLRAIKVDRVSLSEALCARRIRADGTVVDLRGTVGPADERADALLYLNTSLGWPALPGVHVGVAVIDRTSFRNSETLTRALAWCERHGADRIIVVSHLGEPPQPPLTDGAHWIRWAWTPGLRSDVVHELGDGPICGPLSTNPLLDQPPRSVGAAVYIAPELSQLRRTCLRGIAAARRVNPPFPRCVADAVQLVNLLGALWGRVETANVWAAAEPRGTTIHALVRQVRQATGEELRGPWAAFRETHWADLRAAALRLAELLTEYNPRLDMLLSLLDWAAAARPDARVVIRTNSRAGAGALVGDLTEQRPSLEDLLGHGDPTSARLAVLPYSDRLPWACTPALEIHLGVPAPWRRSALLSGEASEHLVVVDADEQRWLTTVLTGMNDEWTATLEGAAQTLDLLPLPAQHIPAPQVVYGPIGIDDRGVDSDETTPVPMPGIDLDRLFAAFSSAVSQVDRGDEDDGRDPATPAGGRPMLARALTLEPDGAEYWLPTDSRAEIVAGSRYSRVAVRDITAGMAVLIPRGESRDELYHRLLHAAHQDVDVMAVQLMLRRFRMAMHELYDRFGSWTEVARALRHRGSSVQSGNTCAAWASGEVIAPEDINDIRRVGRLTWDENLLIDRTWERIGAIAEELRRLHRSLGRLLSAAIGEVAAGRPGPNLDQLSQVCGGIDTTEILEEFEVRQVRDVSAPTTVPSSQLRRLLTPAAGARRSA
ncbi:MAG: hypothetical protein JWM84_1701, partial [Nocardioides sp.]|nr:hypothetical protein [Nocardioides sp.]